MKPKKLLIAVEVLLIVYSCNSTRNNNMSCKTKSAVTVNFPEVSEPVQITSNDKEHFFASYYGINSFSQIGRAHV